MANEQLQMNWKAFNEMKAELEAQEFGRTALFHDGKLIAIYNDRGDAYSIGREKFGLGHFSIETIGEEPKSLGCFTAFVPASGSHI